MYAEGLEQWFKVSKNLNAPINEWNKTVTDLCRKAAQQQLEMMGENFNRVTNQLKRISSIKRPEEFIAVQKDCINEDVTALIQNTQKLIHLSVENMEEMNKLCGSARETAIVAVKQEKVEKEKHK